MKLDHINIYVNDIIVSREFYEAILIPFGFSVVRDFEDVAVGFGTSDYAVFAIVRELGAIQTTHVAFRVDSRSEVDRFYEIASSVGAQDNGPPGLRPHYHKNYYAAFVRDPDGHNIECVCHKPVA
ncbi:MAG: catechol 2,3-dioxygenase-like lactoylglutathione lyase family enzyme [Lysobacterales bacterium]|jgi:catechol 2,3-dioxygenase-like lactoylglutathione lyase family enzyme